MSEENDADAEDRRTELLKRFYLTDCGIKLSTVLSKSLCKHFQDSQWVAFVRSQYKILIVSNRLSAKAAMSYACFALYFSNLRKREHAC